MNNIILSASMMCANFDHLKCEVEDLDEAGIDAFHIDVMDGSFVPNYGMGLQDIESIRKNTKKPIDIHLMTNNSIRYIDLFSKIGADIIYVHSENDPQILRTLMKIKENGLEAGLAINPGTSISMVEELLNFADYLLVMTVNPGFAGQKFIDSVDDKIKKLVRLKSEYDYKIFLDGAISPEKIYTYGQKGIDGFILGTSTLFGKKENYRTIIKKIKE